jgi:hypothetical protein
LFRTRAGRPGSVDTVDAVDLHRHESGRPGLTINKTGYGYTLQVWGSGLSSAVTNAINVTKTGKSPSPLFVRAATATPDALLAPPVLDSPDLWDSLRFKKRARTI